MSILASKWPEGCVSKERWLPTRAKLRVLQRAKKSPKVQLQGENQVSLKGGKLCDRAV